MSLHLPPERAGGSADAALQARRAGLAAAVAAGMWHTDPAPEEGTIGGIRCLRFALAARARGTVVHIHGGAFRIGCPEQVGPMAVALAARCGVEVIVPAYRLAPEHPFPSGLCDVLSVVRALADRGPLMLVGDSAGGGLAAGAALLAGDIGVQLAGLALLSPWLDLTVTADSYRTNAATDPLFSEGAARAAAALYLQGYAPDDPLASPLYGPVAGLPPTYLNVGAGEVLVSDAKRFHDRLCDAGVPVRLDTVAAMEHVAVTRGMDLSGSAETFAALTDFIDGVFAGTAPLDRPDARA